MGGDASKTSKFGNMNIGEIKWNKMVMRCNHNKVADTIDLIFLLLQ